VDWKDGFSAALFPRGKSPGSVTLLTSSDPYGISVWCCGEWGGVTVDPYP